jgi:hypothetical protein
MEAIVMFAVAASLAFVAARAYGVAKLRRL